MGYTHYWREDSRYEKGLITAIYAAILSQMEACPTLGNIAQLNKESADDGVLNLNGNPGFGGQHENLVVGEVDHPGCMPGFRFCKTARKAYDLAVVAILKALYDAEIFTAAPSTDGEFRFDRKPKTVFTNARKEIEPYLEDQDALISVADMLRLYQAIVKAVDDYSQAPVTQVAGRQLNLYEKIAQAALATD